MEHNESATRQPEPFRALEAWLSAEAARRGSIERLRWEAPGRLRVRVHLAGALEATLWMASATAGSRRRVAGELTLGEAGSPRRPTVRTLPAVPTAGDDGAAAAVGPHEAREGRGREVDVLLTACSLDTDAE